jgi:hypothetical protein
VKAEPFDLFGEVPVTWPEVFAWLKAVPRIDPESARADWYIRQWNVPDKIRRAKVEGWFDSVISTAEVRASDFVARRMPASAFDQRRLRHTAEDRAKAL